MQTQIHETGSDPAITLHTRRSVAVSTHAAHHQVVIAGKGAARAVGQFTTEPNAYVLQARCRIEVTVPQNARVLVEKVKGHLHPEGLVRGGHMDIEDSPIALAVQRVGGHASLQGVAGSHHVNARDHPWLRPHHPHFLNLLSAARLHFPRSNPCRNNAYP